MPEGDTLRRAAARLQVLVGQPVEVETPHPRAAALQLAARLDGRRLESVEAVGKNLVLRFEGGLVLRSHLRMSGRWSVAERGALRRDARPWLVLRSTDYEATLWRGPVLELSRDETFRTRLGPDILDVPPDLAGMLERFRGAPPALALGEALLDQGLVAGIGNLWRAEACWEARISPWQPLEDVADEELAAVLAAAHRLMRSGMAGRRAPRSVYRRAGRPCRRCGVPIRSYPQGEAARIAYWCPGCQPSRLDPE